MPEFLQLRTPDEARGLLLANMAARALPVDELDTAAALGRVTAEAVLAPHALPEFPRSTVDGYAVRARDTFGASDAQPAYLSLVGEVEMGKTSQVQLLAGQCALIHTGGMLPAGADAVVMLEHTQLVSQALGGSAAGEIELLRAAAAGENTIAAGEDVQAGSTVIQLGRKLRPAEIGGLMALGVGRVRVVQRPRIGLISSGDEVVPPSTRPQLGQVRDVNTYSLGALIDRYGGEPRAYGIVPDDRARLTDFANRALAECEAVLITAGSSASTRDMTAEVIASLGEPGVLVHGISTRPGKPTILGVCQGKAVLGLPGNPVSALVNGYLFVIPVIEQLLGLGAHPQPYVAARLATNLPSQAGREDWWPVRLQPGADGEWAAEPIFSKSNLIFSMVAADGLLRIPPDATGAAAGETVRVRLL